MTSQSGIPGMLPNYSELDASPRVGRMPWRTIFGGLGFALLYFSVGNALLIAILNLVDVLQRAYDDPWGSAMSTLLIAPFALGIVAAFFIFTLGIGLSTGIERLLLHAPRTSTHFLVHLLVGTIAGGLLLTFVGIETSGDLLGMDLSQNDALRWGLHVALGVDCGLCAAVGWLSANARVRRSSELNVPVRDDTGCARGRGCP